MTKEEKCYDLRIVEKNIKRGLITQQDYDRFLKNLDDSKNNYTEIRPFQETEAPPKESGTKD